MSADIGAERNDHILVLPSVHGKPGHQLMVIRRDFYQTRRPVEQLKMFHREADIAATLSKVRHACAVSWLLLTRLQLRLVRCTGCARRKVLPSRMNARTVPVTLCMAIVAPNQRVQYRVGQLEVTIVDRQHIGLLRRESHFMQEKSRKVTEAIKNSEQVFSPEAGCR